MKKCLKVSTGLLILGATAACSTVSTSAKQCEVTAPQSAKVDHSIVAKTAADLTKFAAFPVSLNVDAEVKNTVDATFQKVPDPAVDCAMLLQTYTCITDAKRAQQFQLYLSTQTACSK